MCRRSYIILAFPVVLASCWIVVEGRQRLSAGPDEAARDAADTFGRKIERQREAIEADLKTGRHEPWEGTFSDGSPIRGLDRGWVISRKKGYVSRA